MFEELGAASPPSACKPNGMNINRDDGGAAPGAAAAEVLRRGAAIGIALDGDADRVIVVDEQGQVVDGDAVHGPVRPGDDRAPACCETPPWWPPS